MLGSLKFYFTSVILELGYQKLDDSIGGLEELRGVVLEYIKFSFKNPAYGRQRISRPMRIVGPIQFWRGGVIYQKKKSLKNVNLQKLHDFPKIA